MMTRLSALLLLACAALALLAATAAADPCPVTAAFNGCFKDGCVTLPTASKKPGKVVCAKCVSQLGYELVYAGTTKARCDCAPGYAGRDNKSICTACPVGTDIAPGGPKGSSVCLRCPPDTLVVRNEEDGSADCACAPGSHRAPPSKVVKGFKAVACKPCTARNAYTEQINVARSCATCPVPQVANTRHDACVDMDEPDAAPLLPKLTVPQLPYKSQPPAAKKPAPGDDARRLIDPSAAFGYSGSNEDELPESWRDLE